MRVAVIGVGLCCAMGSSSGEVVRALREGRTGLEPAGDDRAASLGSEVARCRVDVRPLLRRRKDRKLLSRSAELLIVAMAGAIGGREVDDGDEWGLFVGVGEEPPADETEEALVVSGSGGLLDPHRLGDVGMQRYPPLASLRTLPNLALAHAAIQLGLTGPTGTVAGGACAGLGALREAAGALVEGRCSLAIAAAADSLVHVASHRDLRRRGSRDAPGEAGVALLLTRATDAPEAPWIEIAPVVFEGSVADALPHRRGLGRCGAADGLLAAALAVAERPSGKLSLSDETGARAALWWGVPRGVS